MVFLMVAVILLFGSAIAISYQGELNGERRKVTQLRKEIDNLKRLNREMQARLPVVVLEASSPPKNWQERQKVFSSRKNFSRGAMKMSKSINEKGVVREVGFFRLVMMFGLFAVLANMVMKSWAKIKHNFEEDDDGSDPD